MEPCEQRDLQFWRGLLCDPDVAPALFGQGPSLILDLLENPAVLPLATRNGALLFVSRCGFGKVFELHSFYRRAGWGREVLLAAKACFRRLFDEGACLVFTHEIVGQWRTRPPKSFGFRPMGEPFENEFGVFRMWALTADAWAASPACARGREVH